MAGIEHSEGRYRGSVTDQGWQRAKTGSRMLVLKVKVHTEVAERLNGSGQETVDDVAIPDPRTRTVRLVITPNTTGIVVDKLRNAGFKGTKWSEVDLVGSDVPLLCTHDTWDGKDVEQWDLELPGMSGPLANDTTIAAQLDAEFADAIARDRTPGAATDVAAEPEDDDIPF